MEETTNNQESSQFYFCQNCKQIPGIKMNNSTNIKVECSCHKHDSLIEDSEFSTNYTLKEFVAEMNKKREIPMCSMAHKHQEDTKAAFYCVECQKSFCYDCRAEHDELTKSHSIVDPSVAVFSTQCESNLCDEKIEYYCESCKKSICYRCMENAHENHTLVDLKEFSKKEDYDKFQITILEIADQMKNETIKYNHFFDDLERILNKCREYTKEKEEENANMIKFFNSLKATYDKAQYVANYNSRNNILINNFYIIKCIRNDIFNQKIRNEFRSISLQLVKDVAKEEYFQEIKEGDSYDKEHTTYLEAEYQIKEKKDYKYENEIKDAMKILGEEFTGLSSELYIMMIDGKEVPFKKKFEEGTFGTHQVLIIMKAGKFVEDLTRMFSHCRSLTKLNLRFFDISKAKSMSHMLSWCTSLSDLDLTGIKTDLVTNMGYLFERCTVLTNLDLSSFNTEKVTNMEEMFYECNSLVNLNISGFNTNQVNEMYYIFSHCDKLTNIAFPLDMNKVKKLKKELKDCKKLNDETKNRLKSIKVGFFS